MPNVVDVFAGPGGLAEGFGSLISNGTQRFNIRLSIEKETVPFQTLKLRSFFRSFEPGNAPPEYYDFIAGRITLEALYDAHPERMGEHDSETLQATLGEYSHDLLDERISNAIDNDPNWVLIGGPPCQAYSNAGVVGNRTNKTYCAKTDPRFFLYKEYLRIVAIHKPAIFVMENVRGLLIAKTDGKSIAREVINGLSSPSDFMLSEFETAVDTHKYRLFSLRGEEIPADGNLNRFLVHAEEYGIPQARHRVIIIGIREDIAPDFFIPPAFQQTTTIDNVIGDLPALRSGISREKDSLALWRVIGLSRQKGYMENYSGTQFDSPYISLKTQT
jgi:DNA (cytosine-5)-methyltransferase 1